jgi:hypothetical protein
MAEGLIGGRVDHRDCPSVAHDIELVIGGIQNHARWICQSRLRSDGNGGDRCLSVKKSRRQRQGRKLNGEAGNFVHSAT